MHPLAAPQTIALMVPLLGWSVYRRVRRNISRQPLQPRRLAFRGVFVVVILGVLACVPHFDPMIALALATGCAVGAPLAVHGVRLTRFERTPQGIFYTPNLYLGIGISLVFVARMAYRCVVLYPLLEAGQLPSLSGTARSPLTYATLGLVLGYFAVYYLGVLRASRKQEAPAA